MIPLYTSVLHPQDNLWLRMYWTHAIHNENNLHEKFRHFDAVITRMWNGQNWLKEPSLQKAVKKTLLEIWSSVKSTHFFLFTEDGTRPRFQCSLVDKNSQSCCLSNESVILSVTDVPGTAQCLRLCTYWKLLHLDKLHPSPHLKT